MICGLIFFFPIAPIVVVMPLSFNAQDFFTDEKWQLALKNSLIIAPFATIIAVSLGTLAAIGLSQSHVPGKRAITAILILPTIMPLIISATGMFFFLCTPRKLA